MAQGSHNNDAFMGSAAQFMQAGQNMMQQFMDYLGKAGAAAPATPLPPADPQALTALQKQFIDQQMSLWQSVLVKQQGQEPPFKVAPEPGDRRFAAPEWKESPIYDYVHQAYLLNTKYLKQMVEVLPAQDEKAKERMRFLARQMADAMAPSNFAATNPEFIKLALETKGQSITDGINNLIKDFEKGRISMTDESVFEVGKNIANTEGAVVIAERIRKNIERRVFVIQGRQIQSTVSIGVATFPTHARERETLLQLADEAMYAAKRVEGSAVVVFQREVDHAGVRRSRLTADLREALAHEQFELHYQTIVNVPRVRVDAAATRTARRAAADRGRDRGDPQPRLAHLRLPLADPLGQAVPPRGHHRRRGAAARQTGG